MGLVLIMNFFLQMELGRQFNFTCQNNIHFAGGIPDKLTGKENIFAKMISVTIKDK